MIQAEDQLTEFAAPDSQNNLCVVSVPYWRLGCSHEVTYHAPCSIGFWRICVGIDIDILCFIVLSVHTKETLCAG